MSKTFNTLMGGAAWAVAALASGAAYSQGTVNCANNSGDASSIQSALNGGGTITINGTCAIGGTTLTFGSNVTVNGSATLNYSGGGYIFASSGSNDTITGLTLNGGGINLTADSGYTISGWQNGWTITNNHIQNITSGADGILVKHILGSGNHSTISNNTLTNIWPGGYPANDTHVGDFSAGWGMYFADGIDNTLIDSNTFSEIGLNAIKSFDGWFQDTGLLYTGKNFVVSNNNMSLVRRIGFEINNAGCPKSCNYGWAAYNGAVVSGNYWHTPPNPNANTFVNTDMAFSLLLDNVNAQYYNNSAIEDINSSAGGMAPGNGMENSPNGGIIQGNVITSVPQTAGAAQQGWWEYFASGYTPAGVTNYYQNNRLCGVQAVQYGDDYDPNNGATSVYTAQSIVNSSSCPTTSNIVIGFSSANNQSFTNGGNGTWNAYVSNPLSIRNVSFYVDSSSTPVVVQQLSDLSSTFATDLKWLYHATFSTSGYSAGTHTIKAVATDVTGATQTASQTFTVGGSTPPPLPPSALGNGTYEINSGSYTVDGGFGIYNSTPPVQLYPTNGGPNQMWIWNGSTFQNSGFTGHYMTDAGNGTVSEPTSGYDTWTVTASGANWIIKDNRTGNYLTNSGNVLKMSTTQTAWTLPGSVVSLPSGTYEFNNGAYTVDGGFGVYNDTPAVQLYSTNGGPNQHWIWNGSTLQNDGYTGHYMTDAGNGTVSEPTSGYDTWTVTSSGGGWIVKDNRTGNYLSDSGNTLKMSTTQTVWTAQ